eukprot:CFRG0567T1
MAGFEENAPGEIEFEDQVFETQFSPSNDIIASGLISGDVYLHRYGSGENLKSNEQLQKFNLHKESVRAMQFSMDGMNLFTASADKSMHLLDVVTGKSIRAIPDAHSDAINALCMVEQNYLVSGDDSGVVKVWDLRKQGVALETDECEDFISDITYHSPTNTLLTTCGDGTLSVYNMKKPAFVQRSDYMDEELLSLCVMKRGRKVVCGTQEGVLSVFSWGEWGDVSDRFPGHPLSIDTIVAVNEDVCLTGSSDGLIRAVSVQPNRLLGVVGQHPDFPVERLRVAREGNLVASCSHDKTVQFWNIADLVDEDFNASDDSEDSDDSDNPAEGDAAMDEDDTDTKSKGGVFGNKDDFFDGL